MTCREFIGGMLEYCSDEACEQREELRVHEERCSECANFRRSYEDTSRLCSAALDDQADPSCSEECPEDLVRSIIDAFKKQS